MVFIQIRRVVLKHQPWSELDAGFTPRSPTQCPEAYLQPSLVKQACLVLTAFLSRYQLAGISQSPLGFPLYLWSLSGTPATTCVTSLVRPYQNR